MIIQCGSAERCLLGLLRLPGRRRLPQQVELRRGRVQGRLQAARKRRGRGTHALQFVTQRIELRIAQVRTLETGLHTVQFPLPLGGRCSEIGSKFLADALVNLGGVDSWVRWRRQGGRQGARGCRRLCPGRRNRAGALCVPRLCVCGLAGQASRQRNAQSKSRIGPHESPRYLPIGTTHPHDIRRCLGADQGHIMAAVCSARLRRAAVDRPRPGLLSRIIDPPHPRPSRQPASPAAAFARRRPAREERGARREE